MIIIITYKEIEKAIQKNILLKCYVWFRCLCGCRFIKKVHSGKNNFCCRCYRNYLVDICDYRHETKILCAWGVVIIVINREEIEDDNTWFNNQCYIWMYCPECHCKKLVRTYVFATSLYKRAVHCDKCKGRCFVVEYGKKTNNAFPNFTKTVVVCG